MKAGLAASLGAVKALGDAGITLCGDLLIAGVADEEYASLGTRDLLTIYRPDGAVVTEPSQLEICRAHKGFVWVEVTVRGRAAHGSQWREGIDANRLMGRLLVALDELEGRLQAEKQHPLLGPPNLHAATLEGGVGPSTYAERSVVCIERRTLPGEDAGQVLAEVQALVDSLAAADPAFRATCRVLLERPPFEVAAEAPIVRVVEEAAAAVLGEAPPHRGENPWMDAAFLAEAGVETVVLGPAGGGAHAPEEWVDLESVYRLTEILAETALRYCGRG
jgi:acetylornithine deacetylase